MVCVRERVAPLHTLDALQQAADYWRANIPAAPWFDPCKESLVVLVLTIELLDHLIIGEKPTSLRKLGFFAGC